MINVWDYARKWPYIKIETFSGEVFEGGVIDVLDMEESELPEDAMAIEAKDGEIRIFLQSQLKSVDVIK